MGMIEKIAIAVILLLFAAAVVSKDLSGNVIFGIAMMLCFLAFILYVTGHKGFLKKSGPPDTESTRKELIDSVRDRDGLDRMHYLALLVDRFRNDPHVAKLLAELLADPDIDMQIEAARHLGARGLAHLLGMLALADTVHDDAALRILGILQEREQGQRGGTDELVRAYERRESEEVREAILGVISHNADPAAGPFLLAELARDGGDLRVPIVEALGQCGSVAAVEPLYRVSSGSLNPFVRSAAAKAIERIQSRLGTAERGWLSPAPLGGADGALSVADGAGDGALSIPPKKKD
ncbi:MAG TPA: hypothetical protein PLG31_15815 [Spirochaetota bacterium]|mgnify:FL=1|nr:hypothetical protein [Spirochaetota bacterium]